MLCLLVHLPNPVHLTLHDIQIRENCLNAMQPVVSVFDFRSGIAFLGAGKR
jgi:hypothetical protein